MIVLRVRNHYLVETALPVAWVQDYNDIFAIAMQKISTLVFIVVDHELGNLGVDHACPLIVSIFLEHKSS